MPRCWIGLGGNVGDVPATFQTALGLLSRAFGMSFVGVSRNYCTAPMGSAAGAPFLNAVAEFEATRPALEVLDLLQTVEQKCGRVRNEHWGPRTLDLDLLYYGDEVIKQPRLTTPHPGVWYRRFVLDPLVEMAPDWVDPVWQLNAAQMRSRLTRTPHGLTVFGASESLMQQLQPVVSQLPGALELRDNDVVAALQGGLVGQVGSVVAPHVPRFRWSADDTSQVLIDTISAAATAAFDEPRVVE